MSELVAARRSRCGFREPEFTRPPQLVLNDAVVRRDAVHVVSALGGDLTTIRRTVLISSSGIGFVSRESIQLNRLLSAVGRIADQTLPRRIDHEVHQLQRHLGR